MVSKLVKKRSIIVFESYCVGITGDVEWTVEEKGIQTLTLISLTLRVDMTVICKNKVLQQNSEVTRVSGGIDFDHMLLIIDFFFHHSLPVVYQFIIYASCKYMHYVT